MWKWLEDKIGITKLKQDIQELERKVGSYKASNHHLQNQVNKVHDFVREATTVSADIQYKHSQGSTIVVTGRYRNNDYVNVFTVEHKDMNYIVDFLRDKERTMGRGFYDTPLHMDMKGWIDRG